MAIKKQDTKPKGGFLPGTTDALAAAAAAAGGTQQANAYLAGKFANSYGLKDKTGKLLPDTITGQQFIDAFQDTKNNAPAVEAIKTDLVAAHQLTGVVSPTGTVSPNEVNVFKANLKTNYAYTPQGTVGNMQQYLSDTKNGTGPSSGQVTNVSMTDLTQPNAEASKATINDIFQKYMGRIATEKEIATYTNKFLQYAAQHPVSTTTGTNQYGYVQAPGSTSERMFRTSDTRNTVSTGLNEQDFIKNQVQASGEYNAFQAAGTAFDLMTRMAQKDVGAL